MTHYAVEVQNVSKQLSVSRQSGSSIRELFTRRPRIRHEQLCVLRGIDVRIRPGGSLAVVGHNGSGKSTLLKLLAGIYRPTSGSIRVHGRMIALLELGAGFHQDLTGRENVFLNGAMLGLSKRYLASRMDEIVAFAGIADFMDTPVRVYSSGMLMRLAFAVAIHADPDILVIDEIIAVGDEEFQRLCVERFHQLRARGTTIVIASHNLSLLRELCDEGLLIDHGRPLAQGPVDDVADAYLEAINRRAAEAASPAEAPTDLADSGGGEIKMASLDFWSEGRPVDRAACGKPLTIRLNFEATATASAADFMLSIHHESGALMAQPQSAESGSSLVIAAGAGHVDFVIDALPLQPGTYHLSVLITLREQVMHAADRIGVLVVESVDRRHHAGVLRLPGRWEQ